MSIGVPLGGRFKVTSNIVSLIKGWTDISIFYFRKGKNFVPVISS